MPPQRQQPSRRTRSGRASKSTANQAEGTSRRAPAASSKRRSKTTAATRAAPAPINPSITVVNPAVEAPAAEVIRSSPPVESTNLELPNVGYTLDMQLRLRVNGLLGEGDGKVISRKDFDMEMVENIILSLIESPASKIDGRSYRWLSRPVQFRATKGRATWQIHRLEDLSCLSGADLLAKVDAHAKAYSADRVEIKFEANLEVESLKKAFSHGRATGRSVELSSDPVVETPEPRRTKQLLRESKAMERAEKIWTSADHIKSIHEYNTCDVPVCDNYGSWCWKPNAQEHYAITPADSESWAHKILEGTSGVSVLNPPLELISWFKRRGNKLKVNPHNRRRRPISSGSSSSNDERLRQLQKRVERQRVEAQIRRMEEAEEEREEMREQRKFEREIRRGFQPSWPSYPSNPLGVQHQIGIQHQIQNPTLARSTTPNPLGSHPTSSSPINGAGKEDTRSTVRSFFEWWILQQPEDDRDDFERTAEIAIDQRWTIEDLRQMATPSGELYTVAVSNFKLKDGIVRRLAADIRKYKQVYRGAGVLLGLSIN